MAQPQRGHGRGPGGPGGLMNPGRKAKNFKGSFRRLLGYLKPFYAMFFIVLILAVASCAFNVLSPKIIGNITTELAKIFTGERISMQYIVNTLVHKL